MLQITFHLRSPDAAMFDQVAKACGGRSALVRWMVGELIAGRLAPPLLEETKQVGAIKHNVVEVEFTEAQGAALDAACASCGMCRSQWIHALVSCRLGAPMAFSRGDRVSLRNTTRILKALASDVRRVQFESRLNKAPARQTARLAAIESSMEKLAKSIQTTVDDSILYWRPGPEGEASTPGEEPVGAVAAPRD